MNSQLSFLEAFVVLCALILAFSTLAGVFALAELFTRLILGLIELYREWRFRRCWVRRTPWWRRVLISRWRLEWRN